jgi:hypothetical protein
MQSREAILQALSESGGREGMVGTIKKLIRTNINNVVPLLQLVTPKMVEAAIDHQIRHQYASLEEVDADLKAAGLPPMREIFQIDYRGDSEEPAAAVEVLPPKADT